MSFLSLQVDCFSIEWSFWLIVNHLPFPSASFVMTHKYSHHNMEFFSPTSSEGGVDLQALETHRGPETKSIKSDESTDSSSHSDRNRSQYEDGTGIAERDAPPNNLPSQSDAQDPEAPSRIATAIVDEPPCPLRWWDVSSLIINKMIGTGIFIAPPIAVFLTGNKKEALSLWIAGFVYDLVR